MPEGPVPEYVTDTLLAAQLGPAADPARVALAVGAANLLVGHWTPQAALEDGTVPWTPVDAVMTQAALEAAHGYYRAHTSVGGVFAVEDLLARLPADRVRPIRDLLDSRTHAWGLA